MRQVLIEKLVNDKNVVNLIMLLPEYQRENAVLIAIGAHEVPVATNIDVATFAKETNQSVTKIDSTNYNPLTREFSIKYHYDREYYYRNEEDAEKDRYRAYRASDEYTIVKSISQNGEINVSVDSMELYGIAVDKWICGDKNK